MRWAIVALIEAMLAQGVTPVIPAQGSVGASGDLAPLAHMAAVMIGEGEAEVAGRRMPGGGGAGGGRAGAGRAGAEGRAGADQRHPVLDRAGAGRPVRGLARWRGRRWSPARSSTDAIMGSTAPLVAGNPRPARPSPARSRWPRAHAALMAGSAIRESHRERRQPRAGPLLHPLPAAGDRRGASTCCASPAATLEIEANAVTDNPLVLVDEGLIVSGGNFHAEPVAFAADQIALALAEIGAIAQRRVALMVDPTLTFDLPPFLTPDPGLNSGLMIAEVTTAALMSENKHLAHPCIDRFDADLGQSGGPCVDGGAWRAAAGADDRQPCGDPRRRGDLRRAGHRASARRWRPARRCRRVLARLRARVPALAADRYLAPDLAAAAALVADGDTATAGAGACRMLGMTPVEVMRGDGPVVSACRIPAPMSPRMCWRR